MDNCQVRFDLLEYILDKQLHVQLLENLFLMMYHSSDDSESKRKNADLEEDEVFFNQVLHSCKQPIGEIDFLENPLKFRNFVVDRRFGIARSALYVYRQCLITIPNIVRSWYQMVKAPQKSLVQQITKKHFTGSLISKELNQIRKTDREELGNFKIMIISSINEINAVYQCNQIQFFLKFQFPLDYPLSPVEIQFTKPNDVSNEICLKWVQRLKLFLHKMV